MPITFLDRLMDRSNIIISILCAIVIVMVFVGFASILTLKQFTLVIIGGFVLVVCKSIIKKAVRNEI